MAILVYLAVLTGMNLSDLHKEDPHKRTAAQVLGVSSLKGTTAADIKSLYDLHDVAQLYRALGSEERDAPLLPTGLYLGQSLDVGFAWMAGSSLITGFLMGLHDYQFCGRWAGKAFGPTSGANTSVTVSQLGFNLFMNSSGRQAAITAIQDKEGKSPWESDSVFSFMTHARDFSAFEGSLSQSAFDAHRTTVLDYSTQNPWSWLGLMRDEIRCIHEDLCLGFGGFTMSGGPGNGAPFVLYRPGHAGADSEKVKEQRRRYQEALKEHMGAGYKGHKNNTPLKPVEMMKGETNSMKIEDGGVERGESNHISHEGL
jgi:hypothetical protein